MLFLETRPLNNVGAELTRHVVVQEKIQGGLELGARVGYLLRSAAPRCSARMHSRARFAMGNQKFDCPGTWVPRGGGR